MFLISRNLRNLLVEEEGWVALLNNTDVHQRTKEQQERERERDNKMLDFRRSLFIVLRCITSRKTTGELINNGN